MVVGKASVTRGNGMGAAALPFDVLQNDEVFHEDAEVLDDPLEGNRVD